jgi:hypothetical protein
LCSNSSPVDAVDGADVMLLNVSRVSKEFFEDASLVIAVVMGEKGRDISGDRERDTEGDRERETETEILRVSFSPIDMDIVSNHCNHL